MRDADLDWLLDVLRVASVSPLEGGEPRATGDAQRRVSAGALARGFRASPPHVPGAAVLADPDLPTAVREAIASGEGDFLEEQSTVILSIGDTTDPRRTIVFNFHIDTVGPHIEPSLDGGCLRGRGAVDAKGPGIAALIGIADAFSDQPDLRERIGVVVTVVPGEEGGAFGFYGTKDVLRRPDVRGALMVFLEPTSQRVVDSASGVMTPELVVAGDDSTDDAPQSGTNATLVLAHAAVELVTQLAPVAEGVGAKLCVAGIHTGSEHNRVYGSGSLKLNIAYYDDAARDAMGRAVTEAVEMLGPDFARRFGHLAVMQRTAVEHDDVFALRWQKRGVPALENRDTRLEAVLSRSGFRRAEEPPVEVAFTCDAVWGSGRDEYVVVLGPGDLGRNGAHTADEHVDLDELDEFSRRVRMLMSEFAGELAGPEADQG
ncbi:M20/M25/M40 family metallo-hydrolase [Clavibacter sp. VKM Ac-2872]|uniref:M20/M25/M40 family metallo-hydrolase n=1 Tax=Clavibacter sp. VKM Ac-2872 TaxID=2783812 RepID=UPI00188B8F88|nr:M20/M25/M40 family metallo-hydrolase [Clavibacter sp. VKM Ac-2872]MBF4622769.1 M20/M25/M40 family metallo-hydrolase [Clavibacter sp. VKM Ac-2872]